jgi:hypothetical protein
MGRTGRPPSVTNVVHLQGDPVERDYAVLTITGAKYRVEVMFDIDDLALIRQYRWLLSGPPGWEYAAAFPHEAGRATRIFMHRLLCPTDAAEVDHVDGQRLNNRRKNLRPASRMENARNLKTAKNNRSGYRGVYFHSSRKQWVARGHGVCGVVFLGRFNDVHDAGRAAHEWRAQHWPTSKEAREPFVINENAGRETSST